MYNDHRTWFFLPFPHWLILLLGLQEETIKCWKFCIVVPYKEGGTLRSSVLPPAFLMSISWSLCKELVKECRYLLFLGSLEYKFLLQPKLGLYKSFDNIGILWYHGGCFLLLDHAKDKTIFVIFLLTALLSFGIQFLSCCDLAFLIPQYRIFDAW